MSSDAIVVLGCAVRGGEPSRAMRERVELAVRAYRAEAAPRIVASGGRRWHGIAEALAMKRLALASGVPERAIEVELCSLSTVENAYYTAALMRARGWGRAVVATSPWHLPRALAAFRRVGVDASAPADELLPTGSARLSTRVRERVWCFFDRAVLANARRSG